VGRAEQGGNHGGLNPSLQNFKIWLARNKGAIPSGAGAPAHRRDHRYNVYRVRQVELALAAHFDFSRPAASWAFTTAFAQGTRRVVAGRGADLIYRELSFAVTACAISVAGGITIMASQGGHAAPPATVGRF
jgi:hypothetical protein